MDVVFKQICKHYSHFKAVDQLNLTIPAGSFHFLLGPSGCGKTTTLRMLAGLEKPTSGQIFFGSQDVTKLPAAQRGIGMVFQNYALWPHMNVLENVTYGLKLRKLKDKEIKARADEVLSLTQLTAFAHRLPGQLSGGQQQRVALARALAIRPNVLLLDEPLSNLDAKLRLEMRENLSRIHRETKITTVYVTHDQKEALSMGSEITVLHSGRIVQTGSPKQLYNKPESGFLAGFIGETNLVKGKLLSLEDSTARIETDLGVLVSKKFFGNFKPGQTVQCSIRPESIRVGLTPDFSVEQANQFSLNLSGIMYLGESEQMDFSYGQGNSLKVNLFNAPLHQLAPGMNVSCFVKQEKVIMLPEDQNLGPRT